MNRFNTALLIFGALLIGIYSINPYKTDSLDPRARLIGYTVLHMPGSSMKPAINKNSYVIVKASAYARTIPDRKDIVVFTRPLQETKYVKRVIANEGEEIEIVNGTLKINGSTIDEKYTEAQQSLRETSLNFAKTRVAEGHFFVLGDYRDNSLDSRMFGTIPYSNLVGKVVKVID